MQMLFFLLFAALPFANTSVMGHVYVLELVLVPCLLLLPFSSSARTVIRITVLDIAVLIYVAFNLVSVAVGADSLYESSRYYRLMILQPVLLYVAFRFSPLKLEQLRKGIFLMIPGVLWQTLLGIRYYLQYGRRPDFVEGSVDAITLSVLMCLVITSLVYFRNERRGIVRKAAGFATGAGLFVALIINATRASLLSLVALIPVVGLVWNNKNTRRLVSRTVMGVLLAYLLLILVSPTLFKPVQVEDQRAMQVTAKRLFSPELFLYDLQLRISIAGNMMETALEHPILGGGAASYKVGSLEGVGTFGSVHNFLVSSLIISGVPGLVLTLTLIGMSYSRLNFLPASDHLAGRLGKVIMVNFTVLIFVGITNDLSGGRVLLFFFLIALSARVHLLHGELINKEKLNTRVS